jgi:hypothetical protein
MAARVFATRWVGVLVVLTVGLLLVAACGSSDKWEGTWVQVDDTKTGLEITKVDDSTYKVADPDGSNEFTTKASSDGNSLTGSINMAGEGEKAVTADVTMTMKDDTHITFVVTAGGQNITYELQKD